MAVMECTDCGRALAVNPRRKGTRCQPCAARALAACPEKRRRASEAMQRRFADPVFRARQVRAMGEGLQQALQEDPALRERLREHGRRIGTANKGNLTQPAGGPQRQRAARAQSEFYLGWCPIEYRDSYRRLVRSYGISAANARRMTEDLIAADTARYHATGELPQTTRLTMDKEMQR